MHKCIIMLDNGIEDVLLTDIEPDENWDTGDKFVIEDCVYSVLDCHVNKDNIKVYRVKLK